jgi:outer membrane receptor protein involved in Fe transport
LCGAAAIAVPAGGQSALADDDADAAERIVVTGSRIARDPNLASPAPIQSVDATDITLSGEVNIVDVVTSLPALIGSTNTAFNTNPATPGVAGLSQLNLRNLGEERTLVLVDGYRHVAGEAGSASVDVNTIPAALVERVEVLTGGASSVYGSDAVTGVVNFVLKDDFEGVDVRGQFNTSAEGDAEAVYLAGTFGRNFDSGRGNATLSLILEDRNGLRQGDREHSRGDRAASDIEWPNPKRFIQPGDIDQYSLDPLLLGDTIDLYCGAGDPTLGSGMGALCDRSDNSAANAILPFPRFNLSSYGSLIGVDFYGFDFLAYYPGDPFTDIFGDDLSGIDLGADGLIFDLNNNGVEDCLETVNGTQLQRFGGFAGCHVGRTPGGPVDVFQDGLLAGSANAFGGDGTFSGRDSAQVTPSEERYVVNFLGHYDLTPNVRGFLDAKYVTSETILDGFGGVHAFYDSHVIEWDNPYIPQNLRSAIETFVGDNPGFFTLDDVNILIGRDPTDLGAQRLIADRETVRIVTGLEGPIGAGPFDYSVSVNYGETSADTSQEGQILQDRYYAAADVVTDPMTGDPVCRSELDPTAEPIGSFLSSGGPFRGFLSFTPGQGLCEPLDLFGVGAPSQAAIDFVTATLRRQRTITQTVFNGVITGDSSSFFELPGGAVGVAVGAEYRKEESEFISDPLERPVDDPFDIVPNISLTFPVDAPTDITVGEIKVSEVFGEVSLPLLRDVPFAQDLTLDAAARYSEYDIDGDTTTADSWSVRGVWAPIDDIRFRGTVSQTVRAPNINELFSPLQPTTANPQDPCDVGNIGLGTANRATNCANDGLPANFQDPLTARVGGLIGGNRDLIPETADTFTAGFIVEPRFIPGLSVSVDYYSIEIADAIDEINLNEILRACYDSSDFPNEFCGQFTRDRTVGSATFLGINSFVQQELNFAQVETTGFDYQVSYRFELGSLMSALDPYGSLGFDLIGNHVESLERSEDPADPSNINDLLYEFGQPADALALNTRWSLDRLDLNWQANYYGEFLEITPGLTIENPDQAENAWTGEIWRHDFAGSFAVNDEFTLYAGVNNVFDEQPVLSSLSYPVGLIGREYFIGARLTR